MITRALVITGLVAALGSTVSAESFALVVTGASGGQTYAEKYARWRTVFASLLRERLGYPEDHVILLGEDLGASRSTKDNVQKAFADLRRRVGPDDQLLVLLVGHGSVAADDDGKFNLVGPDLSAAEWAALVRPIGGRVVFVNASSASYPFLRKLASQRRVVVTAADSEAQQFETVFPDYFIKAFDETSADLDKNGRVSIWEAFVFAAAGVRTWYEQRGQLATERALLDDTGAGVGRDAQAPGADGGVARVTYLAPEASGPMGNAAAALLKRKADLEAQVEALKGRKASMPPERYDAELERLLLELAEVSRLTRQD